MFLSLPNEEIVGQVLVSSEGVLANARENTIIGDFRVTAACSVLMEKMDIRNVS